MLRPAASSLEACGITAAEVKASIAKEAIAKNIHGVGFPPLPELIDKVVKASIPVYL